MEKKKSKKKKKIAAARLASNVATCCTGNRFFFMNSLVGIKLVHWSLPWGLRGSGVCVGLVTN